MTTPEGDDPRGGRSPDRATSADQMSPDDVGRPAVDPSAGSGDPCEAGAGSLAGRLQYTSRTLLALTTAVAIACAVFFTLPPWVSVVAAVCVVISMPAVLTVMLIYGRGYTRTFCIGALFPAGVLLSPIASTYTFQIVAELLNEVFDSLEPNIAVLVSLNIYFAVVLGNGLLAVGVRRLMEAGQPTPPRPSPTDEASET